MSAARERARTFVALPLGPQLGSIVAARCAPLLDEQRFRRPRAEGLHLTLHFLGDVAREALHPLAASLRSSLAGVLAPALRLRGAGAFPDARDARVLWVGVEERAHPGRLAACRHAVLEGLSRAGIDTREEAERVFHAHVTVGRPRGRTRMPAEFAALELALGWDPVGVELLESYMGHDGSRYACLEHFPLRTET